MGTYKIFGGGPGGLYTAWRLATGGTLKRGDSIEVFEWGDYDFNGSRGGTRGPAGRICTYHYQGDPNQSYIEVGGMRYVEWNPKTAQGHQLVTVTIRRLGLDREVIPFNTTDDPLLYLRGYHLYQSEIGKTIGWFRRCGKTVLAPYNTPANREKADTLFADISAKLIGKLDLNSRAAQCEFYDNGTLPKDFISVVYKPGETVSNIGYWNVFYDQSDSEAYDYADDAGGYTSNVISWNAADAAIYNGEFAPGGSFKTLSEGYSSLFTALYGQTTQATKAAGIDFAVTASTRLHSIWLADGAITYITAPASNPYAPGSAPKHCDCAFLALPPHSIELVARATRYRDMSGKIDFLNAPDVRNYLGSVILQPSYKVAMFFDSEWWKDTPWPPRLINKASGNKNVFGPSITDLPLRQVYYFGNNAPGAVKEKIYGLLASYDDEQYTEFWQEMQIPIGERRKVALSQDYQPLRGPGTAPPTMERMLLVELARLHYNDAAAVDKIPHPKQTVFMNWGMSPFGAGYHAWASHYDIGDVMQEIRAPARMVHAKANVFLVGEAYSNDQAWVEGAFCTAESVLVDFLGLKCIADTARYPLICGGLRAKAMKT